MTDEKDTPENDPIESTGDGAPAADATPAVDTLPDDDASPIVEQPDAPAADGGIEGEAAAAAAADPAAASEPAQPATPAPEPEPAPEAKPKVAKGKAAATSRKRQTAGKKSTDTAASVAHLAAKKAARPEAKPAPEPTEDEKAEAEAKAENRQRLRDIKDEIADLDEQRAALVEQQQHLATFGGRAAADNRPHHVRHQEVLARSKELREQRKNDRLKLLAASAGKSPLDRAMGEGPRKSQAAADAKTADEKSE
jgi:hypothetical protein